MATKRSGGLTEDNGVSGDERVDETAGETTEHDDESADGIADMLIAPGVVGGAKLCGTDATPTAEAVAVVDAGSAWSVGD